MSERDTMKDTTAEEVPSDEEMRPLPDGGLTEGLPDWLRRPPAWRNLSRKERGEGAGEAEQSLPEPDTSLIDPRTLVDVADLPAWLQQIATRGEKPALVAPETDHDSTLKGETMQTGDQDRNQTPETEERTVEFTPVDKKKWEVPEEETKVYGGGPPMGPNMVMMVGAVAVILIIVLIVVAVIL